MAWLATAIVLLVLSLSPAFAEDKAPAKDPQGATRTRSAASLSTITDIAAGSAVAKYTWEDRGRAPVGYTKGVALSYGRAYCRLRADDPCTVEMAKADAGNDALDALSWYSAEFTALGMDNSQAGSTTLRHLYVLLMGLGMRESSGSYCMGIEAAAGNTAGDTAEAGLFQTSYNARKANAQMPVLFDWYKEHPTGFLDEYREGVPACSAADLKNYGSGDGAEYQRMSKELPDFAAQFTAVGLRNVRKHWGPINKKTAELKEDADTMLQEVERAIEADPTEMCRELL